MGLVLYPASRKDSNSGLALARSKGHPIIVNDVYLPYFNDPARIQIWYGGSGSGKSDAKATQLLYKCLTQNFCRVIFCRKYEKQVRDSQFRLFKDLITRYGLEPYFKVKESEMDIECRANGNLLMSAGLDEVDKLKSIPDITDIWIEEPMDKKGNVSSGDFTELNRRLRSQKASNHIHLTFNPISRESWIYDFFFRSELYEAAKLKTTYLDNHFSPDEQRQQFDILRQTPGKADEYAVYALGEWGSLKQGLVFPEYEIVQDFPPDCRQQGYGLDWGFYPDPCALVRCGIKNGVLYLDEIVYENGLTPDVRAKMFQDRAVPRTALIMADRSPESIADLKRKGWYNTKEAPKGAGSVRAGLNVMKNFKICITARSKNLKTELDNYEWAIDRHSEKPTGEPNDNFNHAIDAARYWIAGTVMQRQGVYFA